MMLASSSRRHRMRLLSISMAALVVLLASSVVTAAREAPAAQPPALGGASAATASALRSRQLVTEIAQQVTAGDTASSSATPGTTPAKTPTRTPFKITSNPSYINVGTIAPEEEATFFGLFPTKNLYLGVGMGGPALFLLYKLLLACWFCTAGRRKFAREDREREQRAIAEREQMEREALMAAQQAQQAVPVTKDYQEAVTPQAVAVAKPVRGSNGDRSFAKPGFWVEEELQAWRLDFQQLKMTKCLTGAPGQKGPQAGEVWLATFFANDAENHQRMVACKWIPAKLANTEVQQEKLKEEIKRQAKLRHPNVAAFIGIAWSPETNFVAVTEYMARGDLRQWLHRSAAKEAGRWTPAKIKMLLDVTNALVYLHSFQPRLIHGNCNSRNVLLNDRMEAKLSDFGAPKDYLSEREIMAYNEVGSGRWISPEALIGRDGADPVSDAMDVYSLGILMVEMDTHQLPFADLMQADRTQLPENDVLQLIASGALSPTLSPTCHPRIQKLVEACTAFNPQKRPSSRDIARALQAALAEAQGQAQRQP